MRRSLFALAVTAALVLVVAASSVDAEPAAPRKPRLDAYLAPGFEDAAWQKTAFNRVLENWKPGPLPPTGKKTVLISTIGRDGTITGAREHMTSGVPAWDRAAAEALKKANPMPPLPKSWPHPTLEVHWHFEGK